MVIPRKPAVVYIHCILAILLTVMWVGGIVYRHNDPLWSEIPDVRLKYDLLGLVVLCLIFLATYGIFNLKEWGRQLGLALYVIIFFTFFLIRVFAYFYVGYAYDSWELHLDTESILISIASVTMFYMLERKSNAEKFTKSGI